MLKSLVILFISYIFIIFEKVPKVTVVMLGAATVLCLGLIPKGNVFAHIDFSVIFLLVSMMIIVDIAGRSGMFKYIALEMLKITKGNPKLTLAFIGIFTAVASALVDNVTAVVVILPATLIIAKELKLDPRPFLITEILCSNIGGTATLIGDPPNIIIGSAAGFTFMDFVKELAPVVLIILCVSIPVLIFMFRKELVLSFDASEYLAKLDSSASITDKNLLIRSSVVLFLVITCFILHDLIKIDAYIVAFAGASILMLFENPKHIIHQLEWQTIFFFVGLFIIIGSLVETGAIRLMADQLLSLTRGDCKFTTLIILWGSSFVSAVVDNIPYTITMSPLLKDLGSGMNIVPAWWALSLGACLGGNATIIGAAANVVVSEFSNASGYPISFLKFMKYGAVITVISMLISTVYVYFRFLV